MDSFVESQKGNFPLIITVPHGGRLRPENIPNRKNGTFKKDFGTILIARAIKKEYEKLGLRPYLVIMNLHRCKIDVNRGKKEGAQDEITRQVHREYHRQIEFFIHEIQANFKGGIIIDLHGQSHRPGIIELGYGIPKVKINDHQGVKRDYFSTHSSFLALLNKKYSVSDILFGPFSLGGLLQKYGYDATPGPKIKEIDGRYLAGRYSLHRHIIKRKPQLSGVNLELSNEIRKTKETRDSFARDLSKIALEQLKAFYHFIPGKKRPVVVIFWSFFRGIRNDDLMYFVKEKRQTYIDLFNMLTRDADLALVFRPSNYQGGLCFNHYYSYRDGKFVSCNSVITADVVLDRSRGFGFPNSSPLHDKKVLNQLDFKMIADDKWLFYKEFKKYSPKTWLAENGKDLEKIAKNFGESELMVIKPRLGMKGEGIVIAKKEKALGSDLAWPVLIQKFVETKVSDLGIGRHDLRVLIVDGEPVYAIVRKPQEGSYLANLAQGGSAQQIPVGTLPPAIREEIKVITARIKKKHQNPYYSIDFGLTEDGFNIFEINNQFGFPNQKNDYRLFNEKLAKVLIEKARS